MMLHNSTVLYFSTTICDCRPAHIWQTECVLILTLFFGVLALECTVDREIFAVKIFLSLADATKLDKRKFDMQCYRPYSMT